MRKYIFILLMAALPLLSGCGDSSGSDDDDDGKGKYVTGVGKFTYDGTTYNMNYCTLGTVNMPGNIRMNVVGFTNMTTGDAFSIGLITDYLGISGTFKSPLDQTGPLVGSGTYTNAAFTVTKNGQLVTVGIDNGTMVVQLGDSHSFSMMGTAMNGKPYSFTYSGQIKDITI